MVAMTRSDTFWMQPVPLWPDGLERSSPVNRAVSQSPSILRFVSDSFMEECVDILANEPKKIGEYLVQPETWRGFSRPSLPKTTDDKVALPLKQFGLDIPRTKKTSVRRNISAAPDIPLKLYQPAHQRYYLVVSSLISDIECLPDRPVDPSKQERAGFVIRRLWPAVSVDGDDMGLPDSTWKEYAFVQQGDGTFAWSLVDDNNAEKLQIKEDVLPLFPMRCASECQIHYRRLLAGLVPVGKREAYMGATAIDSSNNNSSPVTVITSRKILFRTLVSEPWKSLVDTAVNYANIKNENTSPFSDDSAPEDALNERLIQTREQIQTISWLILADFRKFLEDYNKSVWVQIAAKNPGELTGPKRALYDMLENTTLNSALQPELLVLTAGYTPSRTVQTLADALRELEPAVVLKMESSYLNFTFGQSNPDWPGYQFPLADPKDISRSLQPVFKEEIDLKSEGLEDIENIFTNPPRIPDISGEAIKLKIDKLVAVVIRALDTTFEVGEPCVPLASMGSADLREGWFQIRCVYERPSCPVHVDKVIVSNPTEPFQMAGFFDPDAPARPIRIGLPIDTTPAGLRKFNKNTAFVISDILCGQIKRMKGLTLGDLVLSVLPWPFHKDLKRADGAPCKRGGSSIGTICSLSIPIITLCALILLIIMVALFDYIFKWLPFFCMCFPIPGIFGKKKQGASP